MLAYRGKISVLFFVIIYSITVQFPITCHFTATVHHILGINLLLFSSQRSFTRENLTPTYRKLFFKWNEFLFFIFIFFCSKKKLKLDRNTLLIKTDWNSAISLAATPGLGGPPAMTGSFFFFYLSGSSDRFPLIVRISFISVEIGSVVSCWTNAPLR
jgi:hypothetical protein